MQWVPESGGSAVFCTQLLRKAAGKEARINSCQRQERCISKSGGSLEAPENVAVNSMVKVSILGQHYDYRGRREQGTTAEREVSK